MNAPYILPINEAQDPELVGGKAVNLWHLIRNDFPVPDGFVVTTAAYKYSVGSGSFIPDDLKTAILDSYQQMGRPKVAVRSSATAEDGAGASMAGQYETFLGIENDEQLIDSVQKCWESLDTPRTRAYLAENGIEPEKVAMAVVVQRLIPADVAGVLFTTNPHSESDEEMSIEASWGLGEAVVSGIVQPDNIVLNSITGEVVRYQVSRKSVEIRSLGNESLPVPAEKQHQACLSSKSLDELWKLSRKLLNYFNRPQDAEWAICDGALYLLQSRPITTLFREASPAKLYPEIREELGRELENGKGPWARHNLGETLPRPTPLTWSIIQRFMSGKGGYGNLYRHVGFEPSENVCEEGFLRLIGGEIYADLGKVGEMFWEDYPFSYDLESLKENPDAAQQPPSAPSGSMQELNEARKRGRAVTQKIAEIAETLDESLRKEIFPEFAKWCQEQKKSELSSLSFDELVELWEKRETKVLDEFGLYAFLPSLIEANALMELRAFLEANFWNDDPDHLVFKLGTSSTIDKTVQSNLDLYKVSQGEMTVSDWNDQYGHRAPEEFDLATPRWRERPEAVEKLAANLKDGLNPEASYQKTHKESHEYLAKLKEQVPASIQEQLDERLSVLDRYLPFREDSKYYLMLGYDLLRDVALEAGRRLNLGDLVFFMSKDELFESLKSGNLELTALQKRQAQHERCKLLKLPPVIDGESLSELGSVAPVDTASQLKGLSVSNGQASGVAKIVYSPEDVSDLGENYILVCPSTDPSWTPLFVNANAIVLERGGALSHGAVVAREMGIPAVVYSGATSIIQPDQTIWVDGNAGAVYLDEAVAASEEEFSEKVVNTASKPPVTGPKETKANSLGVVMASLWCVYLALAFILPQNWLYTPTMQILDAIIWPIVGLAGKQGTVAFIALFFGVASMLGQRFMTDNARLLEAKKRTATLKAEAGKLPDGDPHRRELEKLAAPTTTRLLKASLVPMAAMLGPMFMVFFWIPEKLAPNAWSADAGATVSLVATVAGDQEGPISLAVEEPLFLDAISSPEQSVPPIRETLKELRKQWGAPSDLSEAPWELRAAALQTRKQMLGSLDSFLRGPIPDQTLTWIIRSPEEAAGHFDVELTSGDGEKLGMTLSLGRESLPMPAQIDGDLSSSLKSMEVFYPLSSTKKIFWAPIPGSDWDAGWLLLYLLAYLPAMFISKYFLRVA